LQTQWLLRSSKIARAESLTVSRDSESKAIDFVNRSIQMKTKTIQRIITFGFGLVLVSLVAGCESTRSVSSWESATHDYRSLQGNAINKDLSEMAAGGWMLAKGFALNPSQPPIVVFERKREWSANKEASEFRFCDYRGYSESQISEMAKDLNRLAADGWRIALIVSSGDRQLPYVFIRRQLLKK